MARVEHRSRTGVDALEFSGGDGHEGGSGGLVEAAGRNGADSALREGIVEHTFVAEVLRSLWRKET